MTDKEVFEEQYAEIFGVQPALHACTFEIKDGEYVLLSVGKAFKLWQASAKRDGFVLVPLTKETAVAIERKVEQQLEASGITADPFRLDGWAILDAISAVEVQND